MTFAYNNFKNKTAGFSPHFLLFGQHGWSTIDSVFDLLETKSKKSYPEYVESWLNAMKEAFSIIFWNVEKSQTMNKRNYS